MDRRNQFQFQGGRNSPSEYEGALSFYLRQDGWNPQQIMDAIAVWRREHDLPAPKYHSRYRATIGKAVAMVTVRSMVVNEPKAAWELGSPKRASWMSYRTRQSGQGKSSRNLGSMPPPCVW